MIMKEKQIHIVPHMHWDREWYFSTEESQILLVNNMDEIMDTLEQHPDYPTYVLDGQTAVLEDYFNAKAENYERVKQLVREGRLKIGPWYTQTDEMVVGAESMTRNLLYGIKDSEKLGKPMMIGYVPDSFGQSAQAPQILNQFGIKHSIFWRGMSERHGTDKTEFKWRSAEGSEVTVQQFPLGYAVGKFLPTEKEKLKDRIDKLFLTLDKRATTNHELIPNGHDQMPIQQNIFEIIDELNEIYPNRNFFLSTYEAIFEVLDQEKSLATIQGELIDGKYARIHRSIYSTRMDLKAANTRIENKITNILEPLASLAKSVGIPYQHGLMELIWKELMKNHAHDSIGTCCSDKVHREILARFRNTEERVDRLIDFYKRRMAEATPVSLNNDKLTLFNMSHKTDPSLVTTTVITKAPGFKLQAPNGEFVSYDLIAKNVIDPGVIDRQIVAHGNYEPFIGYTIQFERALPDIGCETLEVIPDAEVEIDTKLTSEIKTDYYKIHVNHDGTIDLLDLDSGELYRKILVLENQADDGDEYDFSPLPDDKPIYSINRVNAKYHIMEHLFTYEVDIYYTLSVPANLSERLRMNPKTADINVRLHLQIHKHDRTISIEVNLNNQVKDQRTRLLIPTNTAAEFSIADNQFGQIHRPVVDDAMNVWQKEKWAERPDAIYPFLSYVSLSDTRTTTTVFTNSTREYEMIGENHGTMAITLLRSVGVLGKSDLVRRPGRPSGINAPTPDSQLLGHLKLDLALRMDPEPFEDCEVAEYAKRYLTPVIAYNQIPFQAMHLNPPAVRASRVEALNLPRIGRLVISTIKVSEKDDSILLRLFNPTNRAEKLSADFQKLTFLNLNEQVTGPLVEVKPNQVITVKLR